MFENKLIVCFNAVQKRFFAVSRVETVEKCYRNYFYRLTLRLNFYYDDIAAYCADDMRQLCFRKITKMMTKQNMWQDHHSFYIIEYEIRTMARKSVDLIQQNDNKRNEECTDGDGESSIDTNHDSSSELDKTANIDSAYGTTSNYSDTSSNFSEDELNSSMNETLASNEKNEE